MSFHRGNWISNDKFIAISAVRFDTAGRNVVYDASGTRILTIDGQRAWGAGSTLPQYRVNYLHLVRYKFPHDAPDSAFAGIYEPQFAEGHPNKRGRGKMTRQYCHVYESADKERLYIHTTGGSGEHAYEVTWVYDKTRDIMRPEYKMRVVDGVK